MNINMCNFRETDKRQGWSASLLCTPVILFVLSWGGSSIDMCNFRETDKRQAAIARVKQEKVEHTNTIPSPEHVETTRSEIYDKKKDSELHIIASLPKPQSLPAHQLFKDKRKVYQVQVIRCGFLRLPSSPLILKWATSQENLSSGFVTR